jgi:hypothetical protein
MRVIVPYTKLTRGCAECLDRHAPRGEGVYVGGSPTDYWAMMRDAWADGEDFILIEHDMLFEADAIEVLEACPRWLCTVGNFWCLTRFRSELMRAAPDAIEGLPVSARHWISLEWMASRRIGSVTPSHAHFDVYSSNQTRDYNGEPEGLYTGLDRWSVWFKWLRTLPESAADEWTERAWAEVTDDGRACSLPACRRSGVAAFPTVCDKCRGMAPGPREVAWLAEATATPGKTIA